MKSLPLKRRLNTLLLRWGSLCILAIGAVLALHFHQLWKAALEERLLLARTCARYVDAAISGHFQSLQRLSDEITRLDRGTLERLRAFRLRSLFRSTIYVLDDQGVPILADPEPGYPFPPELLTGRELVSSVLHHQEGDSGYVALVQPFHLRERLFYLASEMQLPSSPLREMARNLIADRTTQLFVVDRYGTVISAADTRSLLAKTPQPTIFEEHLSSHRPLVLERARCVGCEVTEPTNRLLVMAPLDLAPWGIVIQQKRSLAHPTHGTGGALLGTLAVLLGVGIVLSLTLSRSLVDPILDLSDQAEHLRRGDLSHPISIEGDLELEFLAETMEGARHRLEATLHDLEILNQDLEGQVAQRTREIERLLEQTVRQDSQRRALVRRLLDAGEEERRRIARELHDEISQLLTVVQLSVDDLPGENARLEKVRDLLRETQREIHRIIYDLRPSLLDDLGLPAAVKWYAKNYLQPQGVTVSMEVEEVLELPPEVEITAFRIYQEIVTNVLRHSGAENASVELYREEDALVLAVEDDGKGFTPGSATDGAGIIGMRERADLVDGTLEIDSEPGLGTHVILRVPLRS
jgi:signal transduction histidine kinase